MTAHQKLVYLIAFVGGFIASYFALFWVFLLTYILILFIMFIDKPKDTTPDNPVYANYQRNKQQRLTLSGFVFIVGAILAFILKYYIIGTK